MRPMPRRNHNEDLDEAIDAMMSDRQSPPELDPRLAALLRIAADLRGLPSAEFKARLKSRLEPQAVAHDAHAALLDPEAAVGAPPRR